MGFLDQIGGMLQQYQSTDRPIPREQAQRLGPALSSLGGSEVRSRILDSASEMLGLNPSIQNTPQQASPEDVARVAAHGRAA